MIRRGERKRRQEGNLTARAEDAARAVGGPERPARGGLTGVLARALGLRRAAVSDPDPAAPAAAGADELRSLREELARELDRVAREQPPARAKAPSTQAGVEEAESTG